MDIIIPDEHVSARHLSIDFNHDKKGITVCVLGRNGADVNGVFYEKDSVITCCVGTTIKICSLWMCVSKYHIFINAELSFRTRLLRLSPENVTLRKPDANNDVFVPALRMCPEYDYSPIELDMPPQRKSPDSQPIMLAAGPALTMAVPILLGSGRKIMVIAGVISAMWASLNVIFRRKKNKTEERKRRRVYSGYVKECEEIIIDRQKDIKNTLLSFYPEINVYLLGRGNVHLVWNRNEMMCDYGLVRCGIGKMDFPVEIKFQKEKFSVTEDSLRELPRSLKNKYNQIENAPILVDILKKRYFAISTPSVKKSWEIAFSLLLQISVVYKPEQMCISVIKENLDGNLSLGFLPHMYYKGQCLVFTENTPNISSIIENLTNPVCCFTDKRDVLDLLLSSQNTIIFFISESFEKIPSIFDNVLYVSDNFSGIINGSNSEAKRINVEFDRCSLYEFDYYSSAIGRLKDHTLNETSPVPNKVLLNDILLEDCKKQRIDTEYILNKWKNSDCSNLSVPIGIGEGDEIICLDIDESAHGPHGLIAGTTGSGKSELLKTLILSLSINFSPEDINFFLIDYKGGGMANDFLDLPHVSGTISNLSGTIIERAMASIRSEIIYRQERFAQKGVSSIKDYRKTDKMPHILIIIDEFAELKREEPDFMAKLISVAQVGRSLGVHLILSTQKPAGIVDDKIWSNSRFRICLKVRDKADSNDMLHRSDAAYITNVGRAYLQVGNDEIFKEFQCGYTSAKIANKKSDSGLRLFDSGFNVISINDREITSVIDRKYEDYNDNITILEFLKQKISKAYEIQGKEVRKLWLNPLKEMILPTQENDMSIGVYDLPEKQEQGIVHFDITQNGNTAIIGLAQSGKTVLIMRILYEIINCYTPLEVNLYILDFGGGRLKGFEKSKMCGGYIGLEESDRIEKLIYYIKDEILRRQKGGDDPPNILIVIDNYRGMLDYCSEALENELLWMLKNGISNKVSFLISAGGIGNTDLSARAFNFIDTAYPLSLKDKYSYSLCLNVSNHILPTIESTPGRGIIKLFKRALEFQSFTPVQSQDEEDWERIITNDILKRNELFTSSSPPYPFIPVKPRLTEFIKTSPSSLDGFELPIGYIEKTGRIYSLRLHDFSVLLIIGKKRSGRKNTLHVIEFMAKRANISIYQISQLKDFHTLIKNNKEGIVLIQDLEGIINDFYQKNYDPLIEHDLCEYLKNANDEPEQAKLKTCGVINNRTSTSLIGRRLFLHYIEHPLGIAMGGSLDEQNLFDFSFMGYGNMRKSVPKGHGCVAAYDDDSFCGAIVVPLYDLEGDIE